MSRGVRDLRELICVSRLSYHEEENEKNSGDDVKVLQGFTTLCFCSEHVASKPECPRCISQNARVISPDSGCIINESPGTCYSDNLNASDDILTGRDTLPHTSLSSESLGKGSSAGKSKLTKSAKKRRKKKELASRHELPKSPTLPPVQPFQVGADEINLNETRYLNESIQVNELDKSNKRNNFDDILPYMDATLVSNWLTRSNTSIQELSEYFGKGNNFVQFAHFWLSDFPEIQKREIFSMEYDILLDEIALAFAVGKENRKVLQKDILELCEAVFKEFPAKLLAENGSCVFLDYLDFLSSEKQDSYKRLLSDVRCSTSNCQYAQWLLATRCFALVNVWSAVVNFYRNLMGKTQGMPALDPCSTKETVSQRRLLQAIRFVMFLKSKNFLFVGGHYFLGNKIVFLCLSILFLNLRFQCCLPACLLFNVEDICSQCLLCYLIMKSVFAFVLVCISVLEEMSSYTSIYASAISCFITELVYVFKLSHLFEPCLSVCLPGDGR